MKWEAGSIPDTLLKTAALMIGLYAVQACGEEKTPTDLESKADEITKKSGINAWIDPSTGCVYYWHGNSMALRHLSNGKPDCPLSNGEEF